ncbi:MAG: DUF1501 domain-containing protein [Acidobacteriota bacterium]
MSRIFNPSRRSAIKSLASASMLLPAMLQEMVAAEAAPGDPLAPKAPMFPAKAKQVIFLYMSGGASHVDTFDPKPQLQADHLKRYGKDFLHGSPWQAYRYAKNDTAVTELFPYIGSCMDEICLVRSMYNDIPNHAQAILQVHGGSTVQARPSIGSWVSYGLGTLSSNLPSYVVLAPEVPYAGAAVWDSSFLPAFHQGIRVVPGAEAIPNMTRQGSVEVQNMDLGLVEFFNRRHLENHDADKALATRVKTFETAYGMQSEAPEVFDISKESDATLNLYGVDRNQKDGFSWMCLMARRLVERGVRFVELIDGGEDKYTNWDAHLNIHMHEARAKNVDRPIAGLLKDLKARGMLEDTLLVFTTEFGRKPGDASPDEEGRQHHSAAYSTWVAGGGFKPGVYGSSDAYGYKVESNPVHIHDFQATLLNQMGLDHTKLTYRHAGRDYRLTDVSGRVVKDLIA